MSGNCAAVRNAPTCNRITGNCECNSTCSRYDDREFPRRPWRSWISSSLRRGNHPLPRLSLSAASLPLPFLPLPPCSIRSRERRRLRGKAKTATRSYMHLFILGVRLRGRFRNDAMRARTNKQIRCAITSNVIANTYRRLRFLLPPLSLSSPPPPHRLIAAR